MELRGALPAVAQVRRNQDGGISGMAFPEAPLISLQMTVDVLGVLTAVAALGSVKRKTDNTELSRRDVTIVDQR
jgi:hypothetical protein